MNQAATRFLWSRVRTMKRGGSSVVVMGFWVRGFQSGSLFLGVVLALPLFLRVGSPRIGLGALDFLLGHLNLIPIGPMQGGLPPGLLRGAIPGASSPCLTRRLVELGLNSGR